MARGRRNTDPDTSDDTGPYPARYQEDDQYSRDDQYSTGDRYSTGDLYRTNDSGSQQAVRSVRPVKRARLGVVLLTVLLTELVIIGAGLNQAVAKHLASYAADHPVALLGRSARALLVLQWRFSSENGHSDLWHAQLITVGLVLLLGILLVPLVVHGPMTWLRAFVGTWFTVTVSVPVAVVAALLLSDLEESRDLTSYVVPGRPSSGLSVPTRIGDATFGPVVSYAFVAGLALGLVVGLLVALVAVTTRRADPVPVAAAPEPGAPNPESPQPFFGDEGGAERRAGYGTAPYPATHPYTTPDRRAETETAAFPAAGGGYAAGASNDTTALPRVGTDRPPASGASAAGAPADEGNAATTSELPRSNEGDSTQAWPAEPEPRAGRPEPSAGQPEPSAGQPEPSAGQPEPTSTAEPTTTESAAPTQRSAFEGGEQTAAFPLPPDDDDLGRDIDGDPDRHPDA